ncbi:MAG: beta-ketoacyl-[acyl-carrier-protein] synthase family protein [Planctomycetales bacterium]|nr:beta-ketoacyl-[acyl-carrier-protein] synthase family protein [Planctomycetales bacterium]
MIAGSTSDAQRIVITGVGLTAPNANSLADFRAALLAGKSGVRSYEIRYVGATLAGVCDFEETRYQTRKEVRRGTRAGSIGVYSANEAIRDAGLEWDTMDRSRVGVYLGVTEHGNVETENEIYELTQFDYDVKYWSHHHNPRTVANNPAGEVSLNLGITGPHYTIGAACAAGNAGLIQGAQMLLLGDCDVALAGGVSESVRTFGIFASFKSQGALAEHVDPHKASRPFDTGRNGIVVSEGGCIYVLERLERAKARGAKIYGEIVGYAMNSDASDFVMPNAQRQTECMNLALRRAGMSASDVDIVSTHATSTPSGDVQESLAVRNVFQACNGKAPCVNNTKSFIGHTMGAAGALELAGNLPAFDDGVCHATINVDELDPECQVPNLVTNEPRETRGVEVILNNSFGMLGTNSALIVKKY